MKTVLNAPPITFGRAIAAARLFTDKDRFPFTTLWLAVKGNTAWLTGMNSEAIALFRRPVKVLEGGDITIALNAAVLDDAWRSFPKGVMTVTLEKGESEGDGGRATFTPVGMTFKMAGVDAEPPDFPEYGKALRKAEGKTVLTGEDFRRLVKIVAPIAGEPLDAVLLEAKDGRLRAVASDGFRLAILSVDAQVTDEWSIPLPPDTLKKIARVVGGNDEVRLASDGDHFLMETDEAIIVTSVLAMQYPDYQQVIPQAHKTRVTVPVDDLKQAMKRVAVVAKRDGAPVRLEVVDSRRCTLSVYGETGEVQVTLPATVEGEVGMVIGFKGAFMQDGVDRLDAPLAVIDLQEPTKPLVLTGMGEGDFRYVLMPVYLSVEDAPVTTPTDAARQPEPAAA